MTLPSCPDSELLAACAEARLAGEERERVLRHVTFCADCYTVYAETLRFLDEPATMRAAAPAAEPPEVAPARPDVAARVAAGPAGEPSQVVPIDRGRRVRRAASVLVPLAAAAALAVVLIGRLSAPPARPGPSVAILTTPTEQAPTPLVFASPTPATRALPVRAAALEGDWGWTSPARPDSFGGASTEKICRLVGVCEVDILVAREMGPAETHERLRWTAAFLDDAAADRRLVRHFEKLRDRAGAGQVPAADELRPEPGVCEPDQVRAGRALEWLRLAARARERAALEHPEVLEGIEAARRVASPSERRRLDALAGGFARLGSGEREWREQEQAAAVLIREWLP